MYPPYIKLLNISLEKMKNTRCKSFDLTGTQHETLMFIMLKLKKFNIVYPKDIQQYLEISKPSVTSILNNLIKKDFITTEPDESDGRQKKIFLTEKSEKLKKSITEESEKFRDMLCGGLTMDEKLTLQVLLEKMMNNIKKVNA